MFRISDLRVNDLVFNENGSFIVLKKIETSQNENFVINEISLTVITKMGFLKTNWLATSLLSDETRIIRDDEEVMS
jgi:hypothetical protein